jgi:effector-binding domain-containing protein
MKILKIIGWVLLALLILLLVLMFVMPTSVNVEKSMNINAPQNMVYNAVNNLKTWETWNPWQAMDENMAMSYGDKTTGEGASYSWTSEKMGNGTYTITEAKPGTSIKSHMDFQDQGEGTGYWRFSEDGNKTNVIWGFDTKIGRPMNLMAPFMKGSMKSTMKNGLNSLKEMVVDRYKEKIYSGYRVVEIDLPERHFVMNRAEIPMSGMQQFYAQNLGNLFAKVQAADVEMDGMPCGLYFKWDEQSGTADMAAAIPVKDELRLKGAMSHSIPSGKALQIDYFGEYEHIGNAHNAIDDYMNDYGLLNNTPIIEEYVTDPSTEKDPAKWLTKVTYYIAE